MKKLLLLPFLVLVLAAGFPAQRMPIPDQSVAASVVSFSSVTNWTYIGNSAQTVSFSPSGSSRYLLFFVGCQNNTTVTVTFNGVGMTSLFKTNGAAQALEVFGLVNPPTGANDLVATISGAPDIFAFSLSSYTGVNQSSSVGSISASRVDGTTSPDALVVSSQTGGLVVDGFEIFGVSPVVDGSQTEIANVTAAAAVNMGVSYKAGDASTTMTWTWAGSRFFAHIAIPLKP